MTTTDIDICTRALIKLGAQPISSFTDGTDRATVCANIYPGIRLYCLTIHDWRFAMKKEQLTRLVAAPVNEYTYQFQLPSDMIAGGLQAVFDSSQVGAKPVRGFEQYQRVILSDDTELYADYLIDVEETVWPGFFAEFVAVALAADIAFAVTDQANTEKIWSVKAWGLPSDAGRGGMFRIARNRDAKGRPPRKIETFSLTDARQGGV